MAKAQQVLVRGRAERVCAQRAGVRGMAWSRKHPLGQVSLRCLAAACLRRLRSSALLRFPRAGTAAGAKVQHAKLASDLATCPILNPNPHNQASP